jgi:hypothetical protein
MNALALGRIQTRQVSGTIGAAAFNYTFGNGGYCGMKGHD